MPPQVDLLETQRLVIGKERGVADEQRRVGHATASASRSGPWSTNRGAMPKYFAVITRVSATEVRELVSSASDATRSIGRAVKIATDATGPSDATAQSGTIA